MTNFIIKIGNKEFKSEDLKELTIRDIKRNILIDVPAFCETVVFQYNLIEKLTKELDILQDKYNSAVSAQETLNIYISNKLASSLVKSDVDCVKICNNFGAGCYWTCSDAEKIDYIKQWILEVINNDTTNNT